eukprot:gnl/MRDRNA2_/MRDRNA2_245092_c0_seq1.p1 gnl/MRDRNA2_/MRDRNA2_245092_c0~~gnl/MRDRNA2_/MRDRNA2_245092_c0_seq1.p1  ORF type:complete len:297 (+),score=41.70 gnl/MRDRNA2_/MRDRNA2_245092_c0_seq1:1-891(+)
MQTGAEVGIHGSAAPFDKARRISQQLVREVTLYSSKFLRSIGLSKIVIVADLHYQRQRRYTIPDFGLGRLFVDVDRRSNWHLPHSFHHELWHMADFKLQGKDHCDGDEEFEALNRFTHKVRKVHVATEPFSKTLACCIVPTNVSDSALEQFLRPEANDSNPESHFSGYGYRSLSGVKASTAMRDDVMGTDNGKRADDQNNTKRKKKLAIGLGPPTAAFLNMYSTTSVGEDKAECWAALVLYPERLLGSEALMRKAGLLLNRASQADAGDIRMAAFVRRCDTVRAPRLAALGPVSRH